MIRRALMFVMLLILFSLTPVSGRQDLSSNSNSASAGHSSMITEALSAEHRSLLKKIRLRRLHARQLSLTDFLEMLAQRTGLSIINQTAAGLKIDVMFEDVTADEALEAILKTHDLACYSDGPVLKIVDDAAFRARFGRAFDQRITTRLVRLKHATPQQAAVFLNAWAKTGLDVVFDPQHPVLLLKGPVAMVQQAEYLLSQWEDPMPVRIHRLKYLPVKTAAKQIASLVPSYVSVLDEEENNLLSIKAPPHVHRQISRWITAWDQPQRSVHIEAKLVQVTLTEEEAFGVDWEAMVRQAHGLDFVSKFDILNTTDKHGRLRIGVLEEDDYTALLEALQTRGHTRILSSPSVTALNNTEARILVGATEPYVTTTTTTPANGPITVSETVNFIDVGVKLYVTPTIYADGLIRLSVRPEVSSVTRQVVTSNNNTIPVVDTSEAEMTLMVKDGVTVVIGGLIKDEQLETSHRVPLLGDLPLLGWMFRNHDKKLTKTEILIFLTPRLFHPEIPAPPAHETGDPWKETVSFSSIGEKQ